MKIKDIRTIALSYKCDPPYASASGVQVRRGALLVEVECDDGTIGIGEAGPGGGSTATCLEKDLKPLLIGEDPLMIEALWQKMAVRTRQYGRRGIVMNAISGIDIALWTSPARTRGCRSTSSSAPAATGSRPMPAAGFTRKAKGSRALPVRPRATAPAASRA